MGLSKVANFLVPPAKIVQNAYPIKVEIKEVSSSKVVESNVPKPILAMISSADISAGEKISKKCTACHSFELNGPNKVGPNLHDIVNKSIEKAKYNYSKAFLTLEGKWSYEELNKFLYKPKEYIKGTKMNFAGLKKLKTEQIWLLGLEPYLKIQCHYPKNKKYLK